MSIVYGVITDILFYKKSMDGYTLAGAMMIFSIAIIILIKNYQKERIEAQINN